MAADNQTSLAAALERMTDDKVSEVLELAMTANQVERDGSVRPDHKTRLSAATLWLAYKHGRPIERQQVLTAKVESEGEAELIQRLAHSPAMREALLGVLREAESKPDSKQ